MACAPWPGTFQDDQRMRIGEFELADEADRFDWVFPIEHGER
jgi:hypothetical protein